MNLVQRLRGKDKEKDMETDKVRPSLESIDAYIQSFPEDIQQRLKAIRAAVKAVVPEAQEKISYQMPTFFYKGNLVYFAAFHNHIGFYPTPGGIDAFEADLAAFKRTKGTVQFPHDKPIPLDLITRITAFRAEENNRKEQERRKGKRK